MTTTILKLANDPSSNPPCCAANVYLDHDGPIVAGRQYNKAFIKGAKLVPIKECGHLSSLDKPEHVINIILQSEA